MFLTDVAALKFQPGQWLDVHVPDLSMSKPGGFTVTSDPSKANPTIESDPYLELAINYSPKNPPAAWLWQDPAKILESVLHIRVGGSFVWPPQHRSEDGQLRRPPRKVVMVAGGVGIK